MERVNISNTIQSKLSHPIRSKLQKEVDTSHLSSAYENLDGEILFPLLKMRLLRDSGLKIHEKPRGKLSASMVKKKISAEWELRSYCISQLEPQTFTPRVTLSSKILVSKAKHLTLYINLYVLCYLIYAKIHKIKNVNKVCPSAHGYLHWGVQNCSQHNKLC